MLANQSLNLTLQPPTLSILKCRETNTQHTLREVIGKLKNGRNPLERCTQVSSSPLGFSLNIEMKQLIVYISIVVVRGIFNISVAQDHLEPVKDLWSVHDLHAAAEARDSLLKGFRIHPLARAISMPDDGNVWAVSLEQNSDSLFIVRSAVAKGGLGFRAMATSVERLAMIRNTTISRSSKPIDGERAKTIAQIFYTLISSARYPRVEPKVIDGALMYFTASKPGIAGLHEGVISAQTFSPVEDKLPKKLTLFAYALFEYSKSNEQNAKLHLSELDSLSRLLSN